MSEPTLDDKMRAARKSCASLFAQVPEEVARSVTDAVDAAITDYATVTGKLERLQTFVDSSQWHKENEQLRQQLAEVTAERDEQCAGKIAFFNGMNDMREQRTKLERQLAKVRSDTQYHMDCITLLAKHIGRLGETSHTVVNAAIQQLATVTSERELELQRNAILLINKIEALRQQLAEVTLHWTTERPTKEGCYFLKRLDIKGEPYGIAQVRSFPFKDECYIEVYIADHWQSLNAFVRDVQCQWAGPVLPPKEAR